MISKGKSDCHVSNDKYREGYDRIFRRRTDVPAAYEPIVYLYAELYKKYNDNIFKQERQISEGQAIVHDRNKTE